MITLRWPGILRRPAGWGRVLTRLAHAQARHVEYGYIT
jgi:hypothetical protein